MCVYMCVLRSSRQRLAETGSDKSHDSQQTISVISILYSFDLIWVNREQWGVCMFIHPPPPYAHTHTLYLSLLAGEYKLLYLSSDGTSGSTTKDPILLSEIWSLGEAPVRVGPGRLNLLWCGRLWEKQGRADVSCSQAVIFHGENRMWKFEA